MARWSLAVLILLCLWAVTAFAQNSPWDKPNPNSPWDKPNPSSPWDKPDPNRPPNPNRQPPPSRASGASPVGNWIAEYRDVTGVGRVTQIALSVIEPTHLRCDKAANGGCYLRRVPVPNADWQVSEAARPSRVASIPRKSTDGLLTMDHPFFYFLEVAQTKLRPSGGGDMTGQWSHGGIRDGKPSAVVWRRRAPRVTRVKFISAIESETTPGGPIPRVRFTYDASYWASRTPAISPGWTVEVYGENLWGHHVVHLPKDIDMVAGQSTYLQKGSETDAVAANVIGFSVPVWILGERGGADRIITAASLREIPKATPGRKTLIINDLDIPFDLEIVGFPGEAARTAKLVRLQYVELRDGKYVPVGGELKHGSVFYVEAAFDAPPADKEYVVKLDWGEGPGENVKVTPSSDAKVFRSEAIRLQAPTDNR